MMPAECFNKNYLTNICLLTNELCIGKPFKGQLRCKIDKKFDYGYFTDVFSKISLLHKTIEELLIYGRRIKELLQTSSRKENLCIEWSLYVESVLQDCNTLKTHMFYKKYLKRGV